MILRLTGYLLALAGFCILFVDGAYSIASSEITLTSFGSTWLDLSPRGVAGAQAAIERYVGPFAWDPVVTSILKLPVFVVALAGGLALAALNTAINASLARLDWRALIGRGA